MNNNGGDMQKWAPSQMERLRSELADGYRRIQRVAPGLDGPGAAQVAAVARYAEAAVTEMPPTWLSREAAEAIRGDMPVPAHGADLAYAGPRGFLLFDQHLGATTLGSAGSLGVAPINGIVWWSARFDGHDLCREDDDPDLMMVHVLSEYLSPDEPWNEAVWMDSTLTDLGMFALPMVGDVTPPPAESDDLVPVIELLLGIAAGVRDGRLVLSDGPWDDRVDNTPRLIDAVTSSVAS